MAEAPTDDREFLKHCANCFTDKTFTVGDLYRLTSMAGLTEVAAGWKAMSLIIPDLSLPLDEMRKSILVADAISRAKVILEDKDKQ